MLKLKFIGSKSGEELFTYKREVETGDNSIFQLCKKSYNQVDMNGIYLRI